MEFEDGWFLFDGGPISFSVWNTNSVLYQIMTDTRVPYMWYSIASRSATRESSTLKWRVDKRMLILYCMFMSYVHVTVVFSLSLYITGAMYLRDLPRPLCGHVGPESDVHLATVTASSCY